IIINILKNKERGAKRDIVILNSAFLLKAAGKVDNIEEGIDLSRNIIEKGIAYKKFMKLIDYLDKI
ncbi:anthranilate phosphoribosyltransferase, partial [bacterium]|nr:anthranilate phosphoribosyltransferase [bacterium]